MSGEAREVRAPEVVAAATAPQIASILRHRTERLGPTSLRDEVSFTIGRFGKVPGEYTYKEQLFPDVEMLESSIEWLAGNTYISDQARQMRIAEAEAQLNGPRSRVATLSVNPETGERVSVNTRQVEDQPATLRVEVGAARVELTEGTGGQWTIISRTKKIESSREPVQLTDTEVEVLLTTAARVASGSERKLDRAVMRAEIARLESRARIANQMGRSAEFLDRTRLSGGEYQNRPANLPWQAPRRVWQDSVARTLPPAETDKRIRQGYEEGAREGQYHDLIRETRRGRRTPQA